MAVNPRCHTTGKQVFFTATAAHLEMQRLYKRRSGKSHRRPCQVYKCQHCAWWHFGSKKG